MGATQHGPAHRREGFVLRPDPSREATRQKHQDPHASSPSQVCIGSGLWIIRRWAGKSNINKNIWGSDMDRDRIVYIIKLALVLIGMSVLLPACVSTGSSTSGHVDARLREHGV
ncbi:hypothetical protein [uncultured Methylobacterium sp.]|uniref:hypothetical protein n=1 Tax=uncultured Methylobacterium sp. TaxID=157278 RepID=UPI00258BE05C|nr:hypothetical protein [uncultured Methylobacterium sp.]